MKRLFPALLLAATALLGTAACGDDPDVTGDSVTDSGTVESPAPVPS